MAIHVTEQLRTFLLSILLGLGLPVPGKQKLQGLWWKMWE